MEWNKQYTLYFLTTHITLCLTTKLLSIFPAYGGHMLKMFSLLFHIYQPAQSQKHVSTYLLKNELK